MSVQTGEGPLRVDADDLQLTHRGKTIAVKIRMLSYPVIMGVIRQANGSWLPDANLDDEMFGTDVPGEDDVVEYWVRMNGGAMGYVRTVILPRLNAWLAQLFPPLADAPSSTALEQVQAALRSLRLVVHADGTVTAVTP